MTTVTNRIQVFWEGFGKYVGVQGIMGLVLLGGFVFATLKQIALPELYSNLMTLVIGYYFAKNGVGILAALNSHKK